MLRLMFLSVSLLAAAIVLAELCAVAVLWSRGALSTKKLGEIRLLLADAATPAEEGEPEAPAAAMTSESEIREARITRVLELQARENELSLLKRMTTETANRLISDRQSFDQLKEDFRLELDRLKQLTTAAATEQTRAVLLATPPEDAVQRLMGLELAEAADLLRGLPEKSIARILAACQLNPKTQPRGQELFEALYHGDPQTGLIENVSRQLKSAAEMPVESAG